ncbi:DUF397 domain-containing protein [Streptomyces sp. NPDC048376]|uniref:DUF397 domain-containing protein n=1 Tax=Streptomyces sp. NPDC048376 TaxID=3154926 RepID=UPI00341614F5
MIAANSAPHWFKSSYSGGSGTECVECAYVPQIALIRDSKRIGGPIVSVTHAAWHRFIDSVCHGMQKSP